ncbi:nuclear transport factor 2 family protein [Stenotrophomonas sp. Sm0581]|uniref:nuclear transport factor 2 family protein n=1 Tax=Stenotrophomonas sp. Sm0581 TaxID=3002749 RepID=UPI0027E52F7E|nr:nuclear transport factor 2 family protein [Stenotrophomonas sp. Sm0581]MDQ7300994.1 nuclear transport factor 2 family protein [Stenotrophomonas sp. Sm0581]
MSLRLNAPDAVRDTLDVVQTLYRFAAGIDLRDRALLSSAFAENAISDFRPAGAKAGFEYPVLQGRETIVEALSSSLAALDTTHSYSNPRVVVDGDTARVDVPVEAQHVLRVDAARQYLMKNRYDLVLAPHDAGWEIEHVIGDNVWRTGDPGVLGGI